MTLLRFGEYYLDVERIVYVHRFPPRVAHMSLGRTQAEDRGGVRIGFRGSEITLYSDEPGYEEFVGWLDNQVREER